MLTAERLKELLHYDPASGAFRWRVTRGRMAKAGDIAGWINSQGYLHVTVDSEDHKAHRLAFLYMTGAWPKDKVDHRDLDKANNAWANLREATNAQNCMNKKARADSTLGVKGVGRNHKGFKATIQIDGKRIYLGTYGTIVEAKAVYDRAARDLHGEYGRAS